MNFKINLKKIIISIIFGVLAHIFLIFSKIKFFNKANYDSNTLLEVQKNWIEEPICSGFMDCFFRPSDLIILMGVVLLVYLIYSLFQKN